MLATMHRPEPLAMLNHRERVMPLPYHPTVQPKAKTRKLSVLEGDPEHVQLTKKHRRETKREPEGEATTSSLVRRSSLDRISPFDLHLQAVYEGEAEDGLQFFESHGYYDITDANTVAMFRQTFGLGDGFWLGKEDEAAEPETVGEAPSPAVYPFGSKQQMMTSRLLLHRQRTNSGRFTLLDDNGHEVDDETLWELEREDRLKAKSLELDDDELAELVQDQLVLVQAVRVIRSEKNKLQQFFQQAFHEKEGQGEDQAPRLSASTLPRTRVPATLPPADLELPPYCGYVNLLKDTIPFLMRSWHKRWFYLDFQAGVVLMYKRSYWKSPRGVVDLRDVAHVEKMSQGDFRIEFKDTGADAPSMMLMRTKLPEEATLWVNLLRFAKQTSLGAPRLTATVMDNTKAIMKKANKKNQVDILAQLLTISANNAGSSNLRAIAQASAVAASAVSKRR
ncbi:hypothetical protein PsorP6_015951 [Peronosclerospora sorghi]|uniref:Uncharacterized protein n=1 Tax=Peronosclerospora sorghi TaxID=230839 RepID=A0ACC0WM87_9STRA|nr:hypothetical protein PsorP6_015951 [Peronosclerospora sorghi]